jgi:mannuronan 5-epimerase
VPTPTIQKNGQTGLSEDGDDDDTNDDNQDVNAISYPGDTNQNDSYNSHKSYNSNTYEQKPVFVNRNNGDNPNGIHVFGSLKIDSVKITSWDSDKKEAITFDFGKRPGEELTKSKYDTVVPRPFIRVSNEASGRTNITNSEIAYLGYSCSRCSGISYYGGICSMVKGNNIHHLLKGFYSKGMGAMVVENNTIHDNYLYGIDPHTGTHDMIIRNNKVYGNNASAIICSKHCYNILFEGNEVYKNGGTSRGIALSINTTHSIVRNNNIHDQISCTGSNRGSNFNTIVDNVFANCKVAVNLADTSNNIINSNKITGGQVAIVLSDTTNKIFHNKIENSTNGIVLLNSSTPNPADSDNGKKIEQVNSTAFLNNMTVVN